MSRSVEIRKFRPDDGPACHQLRCSAFQDVFCDELPAEVVKVGVESYGISEFAEFVGSMRTYVATLAGSVVGFCSIRLVTSTVAELLYLYIGSSCRGMRVGSKLSVHAEHELLREHEEISTIFLVTAVPRYNQGFWERKGYHYVGSSSCEYPSGSVPAVRLEKKLVKKV